MCKQQIRKQSNCLKFKNACIEILDSRKKYDTQPTLLLQFHIHIKDLIYFIGHNPTLQLLKLALDDTGLANEWVAL